MDRLTVEDFRCFGGAQTARLAPLTLLVGENSTGKTSFMAMASILWEVVYGGNYLPDFKKDPFDLGTFQNIVHEDGGDPKKVFSGGFGIKDWTCRATFQRGTSGPEAVTLGIANPNGSVTWSRSSSGGITVQAKIGNSTWRTSHEGSPSRGSGIRDRIYPGRRWGIFSIHDELDNMRSDSDASKIMENDKAAIDAIVAFPYKSIKAGSLTPGVMSPVRSRPERIYEQGYSDPGNERIPQYLATLHSDPDLRKRWKKMKQDLDAHGRNTGLFEEIDIRPLGKKPDSDPTQDPFQLEFRIRDGNGETSWRNIVDVGYGVSQILPVLVELIKGDHPLLLLQQPEVHLHPSAQAGLGSILCAVAGQGRRILVETHSDYLIDRVRMDVRDQKNTKLKPEDVSILYFEGEGPSVKIHDIKIDQEGNVLDAPSGYRQFFKDEMDRDLGF